MYGYAFILIKRALGKYHCIGKIDICFNIDLADWWIAYGDEAPELKNFAVKILSLTCSSSGCERNWSTFSQVFIRYNHINHLLRFYEIFLMLNCL